MVTGIALVAIAVGGFLIIGRSDDESDTLQDSEAKADVRTAQTAIETYATDNDGYYEGASADELQAIEPTVPSSVRVDASHEEYTLTIESESENWFSISRGLDGTVEYTCEELGNGGCPSSGDWAG